MESTVTTAPPADEAEVEARARRLSAQMREVREQMQADDAEIARLERSWRNCERNSRDSRRGGRGRVAADVEQLRIRSRNSSRSRATSSRIIGH